MRGNPRLRLARAALAALLAAAGGCHTVLGPAPLEDNWRMHPGPRVTFFVRPDSFAEQNIARLSEVIEDQVLVHRSRARPLVRRPRLGVRLQLRRRRRLRAQPPRARVSGDRVVPFRRRSASRRESVLRDLARGEPRDRHQRPRPRRHVRDDRRPRVGARVRDVPHARPPFPVHVDADRAGAGAASRAGVQQRRVEVSDGRAAYNTSASFLAWLLDTYGADRLRQIYGAPSREFADRVNAVYGRPLESLEADWLRFCDAWVG